MVSVRFDSNSFKWEESNTSGYEYIDIGKSDFVIKAQFLWLAVSILFKVKPSIFTTLKFLFPETGSSLV